MRQFKSWMVWGSSCPNGPHWRLGCAPSQENQNITRQVRKGQDGNMRLPVVWNATVALRASCLTSAPRAGHVEIPERSSCRNSFLDDSFIFV